MPDPRFAFTRTTWLVHGVADASRLVLEPNAPGGPTFHGRYRTTCGRSLRAWSTMETPKSFARCPHCVEAGAFAGQPERSR